MYIFFCSLVDGHSFHFKECLKKNLSNSAFFRDRQYQGQRKQVIGYWNLGMHHRFSSLMQRIGWDSVALEKTGYCEITAFAKRYTQHFRYHRFFSFLTAGKKWHKQKYAEITESLWVLQLTTEGYLCHLRCQYIELLGEHGYFKDRYYINVEYYVCTQLLTGELKIFFFL